MMPPTKLPDGRATADRRWSTASLVTRRSELTDQQPMAPARPALDGLGRPSTRPQRHPGRAARPLTPWQRHATALAADLESP